MMKINSILRIPGYACYMTKILERLATLYYPMPKIDFIVYKWYDRSVLYEILEGDAIR